MNIIPNVITPGKDGKPKLETDRAGHMTASKETVNDALAKMRKSL